MKIAVNRCFGGFSLSDEAIKRYGELKGLNLETTSTTYGVSEWYVVDEIGDKEYFWTFNIERDDPILIQVLEELGKDANGSHAKIEVVEIPDDVKWQIEEYDGAEHIAEVHRTW